MGPDPRQRERDTMVDLVANLGVSDPEVLAVMRRVPRERFLPDGHRRAAYDDRPVPIGEAQTISQPFIVGFMTEASGARRGRRVLEVGTGSGYQAAVLAGMGARVWSVEVRPKLAERARRALEGLGLVAEGAVEDGRVALRVGDGAQGWPEEAPFDAIVVTAAAPEVPPALLAQLAPGGRLVAPVGDPWEQVLVRITRDDSGEFHVEPLLPVVFVPLVGPDGGALG